MSYLSHPLFVRSLAAFCAATLLCGPAHAQEVGEELDLDALFNTSQVGIATKRNQTTQEAPAVVEVVTAEEIRERGYASVAEALRSVPGFYVVDDQLLPNVGVRGLSSGQRSWSRIVKLMIDLQPVPYRPDGSNWLGPELIPIHLVKRIEIIRGPASALYGADAFLGVINVVTKRAEDLDGTRLEANAGLRGALPSQSGALSLGTAQELASMDLSLGASLGRGDRSGLKVPGTSPSIAALTKEGKVESVNDLSAPGSFFGRLALRPLNGLDLSVDGAFQRLDAGGEFQDWKPLTHQNRISQDNRYLRTQARQALGSAFSLSSAVAYSYGAPTADDRISIDRTDYYIQRKLSAEGWDVSTDLTWSVDDRNTLTVGADWTRATHQLPSYFDVFTTGTRAGQTVPDGQPGAMVQLDNLGGFVQGIYYPTEDIGVTMNLRNDVHNVYGNNLSSRLGLVYRVNESMTAKALYGTSFKAPSAPQLYGKPLLFGDILGNEDLKPERASTLEGAISYAPSRALDLSSSIYYTHVSDKVSFFTRNGNPFAVNLGQLDSAGIETGLKWRWSFLHGMLNTSLQSTVPTLASGFPDPDGVPEPYPAWMVNAGVGARLWSLPLNWFLEERYVHWVPSSQANFAVNGHEAYAIAPSFVTDLTLTSRDVYLLGEKEAVISFKVANVFDATYAQPGYGGVDYQGLGRTFLLRISQGF